MEDQSLSLLELLLLSSLITGSFGAEVTHVFFSSGENVCLSCNEALPGCRSTSWFYNGPRHSGTVELFTLGEKKTNFEGHERLSLGSDCSLNIRNITTRDYGLYICQQWTGPKRDQHLQGSDEHVSLHVLDVSSQISPVSMSLSCRLYSYAFSCDDLVHYLGLHLSWVDEAGVELKSDSRSQIFSSSDCIISLNTTLLNEEDSRDWRCQLKLRDQVKTTFRYTLQKQAQVKTTTTATQPQDPPPTHTSVSKGSEETFCIAG